MLLSSDCCRSICMQIHKSSGFQALQCWPPRLDNYFTLAFQLASITSTFDLRLKQICCGISDICRWAALICLFTAVIIVEQVLPNWEPPFMFTRWRFKQQRLAWLWLLERPFNNLGAFYLQHRIFSVLIKPDRTVLIELTRGLLLIPGITIEVGMAVLFIRSAGHCWLAFVVWRFATFSAWKCLGSHVVEMLMQQLVQKTCGFLNVCLKNGSRNGKRN